MPSAFVPFLKRSGGATATAVPPATDSAAVSGAFAALTPASPAGCAHAPADSPKPSVTLQKDGERVTHIRVQCACGQVTELECLY